MSSDNKNNQQNGIDDLAEQINLGIAKNGIHMLDGGNLEPIWNHGDARSEDEKRREVEAFALNHQFGVQLGGSLRIAIFQKLN